MWNQTLNVEFEKLSKRCSELSRMRVAALEEFTVKLRSLGCPEEMQDWLIRNVDEVRDALEPFDSGKRRNVPDVKDDESRRKPPPRAVIEVASGKYLDRLGEDYRVIRFPGEADDAYRARILRVVPA